MVKAFFTKQKICVFVFFFVYLLIGLSIYKDYGLSWDEWTERITGHVNRDYVLGKTKELLTYKPRFYGPVFEMSMVFTEHFFKLDYENNSQAVFYLRHLMTFLLFYVSVFFFYKLGAFIFKDWRIGLLGSFFLIVSPQIFAHSFYNPKDIPCLATFIFSYYTMVRFLREKTVKRAIWHAFACALVVDVRIMGVMVPFFTVFFYLAEFIFDFQTKKNFQSALTSLIVYILFLVPLTILFFPILWTNPIGNLMESFNHMSRHKWEGVNLYFGEFIPATNLPWHYIPVWIGITTPIVYLILFILGNGFFFINLFKAPIQFYREKKEWFLMASWFFAPFVATIMLKSVLYDGWRQMFFVYPAFLVFVLIGLTSVFQLVKSKISANLYQRFSYAVVYLIFLSLVPTIWFMVKNHPFQNVYFNALVKDKEKSPFRFEMDYWGNSYRQALEYILENDSSEQIPLIVANSPGWSNARILDPKNQKRLVYVNDPKQAKYFVSNYRLRNQEYPFSKEAQYYSIVVDGLKIMVVYRFL